jgi:hypothetical protein
MKAVSKYRQRSTSSVPLQMKPQIKLESTPWRGSTTAPALQMVCTGQRSGGRFKRRFTMSFKSLSIVATAALTLFAGAAQANGFSNGGFEVGAVVAGTQVGFGSI